MTYVDLPAPPPSTEGHVATEISGRPAGAPAHADALLHVVRAFEDPAVPHPDGSVDPARDVERLELEFVLADLAVVEKRSSGSDAAAATARPPSASPTERELEVLGRILPALRPARRSATSSWPRTTPSASAASAS